MVAGADRRPEAVAIVSAHWIAQPLGVTTGPELATLHDFGGFPEVLYRQRYAAPGDDALSGDIRERLQRQGFTVELNDNRGLDHGAWVPLKLIFTERRCAGGPGIAALRGAR